jgi:hypothetical protein
MSFTLVYGGTTVILPSPELDDAKRFSTQAVKRWGKCGLPRIVKDPTWPVFETYSWKFRAITQALATDFINLYKASKGQVIQITDHLGVGLTGIITSPAVEVLTMKDVCSSDFEFDFLATRISFATGTCLANKLVRTPVVGDADYNATLENNPYTLTNQSGTEPLLNSSGQPLVLEP